MLTRSILNRLSLKLKQNAVDKIEALNRAKPEAMALRIQVEAGGCSGFQYKLNLVPQSARGEEDTVVEQGGAQVFVDKMSSEFLQEAEVDFKEELVRSAFVITANKLADSKCGCGASFNVGF